MKNESGEVLEKAKFYCEVFGSRLASGRLEGACSCGVFHEWLKMG